MSSWIRNCYGLGVPTSGLVAALRFTFLADLLLAPIGLAAVLALPGDPAALLLLVPPTLLLAMLQRDRAAHINRAVTLGAAVSEAADRARRDALTGLRNRLAWEEAIARHRQLEAPVGIVLLDVDGLKLANDAHGHDIGDLLLVAIGRLIEGVTPSLDGGAIAARLGGDEFGILLPGPLAKDARAIADRLLEALDGAEPVAGLVFPSGSIGVGSSTTGADLGVAISDADRALYDDKQRPGIRRR